MANAEEQRDALPYRPVPLAELERDASESPAILPYLLAVKFNCDVKKGGSAQLLRAGASATRNFWHGEGWTACIAISKCRQSQNDKRKSLAASAVPPRTCPQGEGKMFSKKKINSPKSIQARLALESLETRTLIETIDKSFSAAVHFVRAITLATAAVLASSADGDMISYPSRSEFNAAHPRLPIEDFETGTGKERFGFFESGLDSNTTNGVFSRGDILAGISFCSTSHEPDLAGFDLFAAGPGAEPRATSTILGQTYFKQSLDIYFASGVSTVGLDISVLGAAATPANVVATLFGTQGRVGEFNVVVGLPDKPTFFGLYSDVPIVRLNLADANGQDAEIVDNIAFGMAGSKVPEPSVISIVGVTVLGIALRRLTAR